MVKLNKRQIIILIIAATAIVFAAYSFLSGGKTPKEAKESNPSGKDDYISSLAGDLMKNRVSVADAYIVSRAEADWGKNPFWEKGAYREWAIRDEAKSKDDPAAKIIYSGYVDVGKKKMAVINGLEYSIGDKLEIDGYVLKKITAAKVVISNKARGSELEIILQE
ncbi:MAG: hypothetical protein CVU52_02070 [Deltaproteobacteria bacterium HGW-Deltaproteobacteria-10]|nr:MAG: hypothetical protein CVU52_02070 [Deltaproteobacteria bacterium HGW-Deltaproteobacteria-10]